MKNGLLIWNVILTLVAGYLLFNHFSSKKGNNAGGKSGGIDTAAINSQFRLAYFEMDSVANNFEMVKEVKTELSRKETQISVEIEKLAKNLQQRYAYFQNKKDNGTLTQQEAESASAELNKMDEDIKIRKQQLDQDYFDFKTRRENEVKKNIENFIKEYNKDKKYTYIMSYEPGLFYYKDTALNITADVIKGLNVSYTPAKKEK
ncbi:MAG: OmpH family outer membrane protein [Chitinophagaceae bacterium]|nr:OmpH family outer membrane protein [Chitinophagaceae bacterium]